MESEKKHIIVNACPADYSNIKTFFYSTKTKYFGRHRRTATLYDMFYNDYKTHRIMIPSMAAKHVIIGYAEVSNAPQISALPGDLWLDFIKFHYCCDLKLSATNTCFLNKFVYNVEYIPEMLKQLLSEVFYREDNLKFIIVLESPDYRIYPESNHQNYYCLEGLSTVFYPKCFSALTCNNTQKLHVIRRDITLSQIRYRKALPEDNDDLVEISNQDNTELKERMGDYYIAEELLSETKCWLIVTEIKNVTAGFVWLNDNIGLLYLLQNYYLQPFGNLLKFNPKERFKEKALLVSMAQKCNLDKCFVGETINDVYICAFEGTPLDFASNISLYSRMDDGDDIAENPMKITRPSIMMRWDELDEKLKSYSYYTQVHKRHMAFFYNIPDGESDAPWDARANAFAIQLFGLMKLHDPRRVFRLLSTAFSAYPEKDYCLLSIKAGQKTTAVLSEFLKYFIPVIFRPNCEAADYLFITHRCAVTGDISLYAARECDEKSILNLLKQEVGHNYPSLKRARSRISTIANKISVKSMHLLDTDSFEELTPTQDDVIQVGAILKNIFEDPFSVYKCFTIRCGDSTRPIDDNKIVGFVVIRPFTSYGLLEKHFHIFKADEFQKFNRAEIVVLKLHDFFHFQADLIFRELARQTDFYYFYYFKPTDRNHNYNDLINNMQPVEPRRIKRLWFNYLGKPATNSFNKSENQFTDTLDLLYDHFAVFKNNLKPSINFGSSKNIVILGFTDICKALLRLLIFNWHNLRKDLHSTYNCLPSLNITVICNPGIMEADHEHGFQCKTCPKEKANTCWVNFKNSDAFIRDVCERLDVRTWIRFISGKVKSIDSERNLIVMRSQCEIYYEILLLLCGTDYGVPKILCKNIERPSNYSHFNNRFDKILFYHKLKMLQNNLSNNLEKSIIVYGCHLRAYEFVNFLLQHDVKGSEIHLVIPRPRAVLQMGLMLNNSAEDTRIEEILKEMVEDLGVQTYDLMNIESFSLCEDQRTLKDITFRKPITHEQITIQCDLFVSFYEKFLSDALLKIFKTADIKTEHDYVLVDENYETSAQNVFAMGNFIKFKTEPNYQYRFVSPQEAAEKLVKTLGIINTEQIEAKFSKSSYFQAQLPMDYLLVKVNTPKRYLANHLDNEYGFPLNTYCEGEFSRVRLNERGMVEEIVIVTKRKINYDFLKFFCGRHELLLNNLKSRWFLREIDNFIDFFQETWTELLMHDEFESLRQHNTNLIKETAQEVVQMDMDRDDKRKMFYGHCQDLGITAQLEFAFLEFIRHHRDEFSTDIAMPEDFARRSDKKL